VKDAAKQIFAAARLADDENRRQCTAAGQPAEKPAR